MKTHKVKKENAFYCGLGSRVRSLIKDEYQDAPMEGMVVGVSGENRQVKWDSEAITWVSRMQIVELAVHNAADIRLIKSLVRQMEQYAESVKADGFKNKAYPLMDF